MIEKNEDVQDKQRIYEFIPYLKICLNYHWRNSGQRIYRWLSWAGVIQR